MAREMAASAEYDGHAAALGSVIDPQRYPALALAIEQQAFGLDETHWAEGDLRFGLDRLLDGYEQFVRSFET
ncbi:hypothetical protein [Nocardia sp. NPDC004604]|uniref:hypothetical protein n=1 Tax=Nocardia sp. NPDC004604 TaxID=3157013 RepID=UPI0033BBB91C